MSFAKCIMSRIHHYGVSPNSSTALKLPVPHCHPSFPLHTPRHHWSFTSLSRFASSRMSYSCNHTVCSLSRLTSLLSNMHLSLLYVLLWLEAHFVWSINNILSYRCTNLLICSSIEGHLDCVWFLVIMNKAPINICLQFVCLFVET